MISDPYLLGFILCDRVFREHETGKVHVSGTFNQLAARKMPLVHNMFYIYLCLTNVKAGNRMLTLDINYLDNDEEVHRLNHPFEGPGLSEILEICLSFSQISFSHEGTVELVLHIDNEQIAQRPLKIKLL